MFQKTDCLIIVDLQNDFCPGGALAVKDGDKIVESINRILKDCPFVVTTQDWHPENHCSFKKQGGLWPPHCVQGTRGAELHSKLDQSGVRLRILKGQLPDRDAYSGFQETSLNEELKKQGIKRVFLTGLATDYCVKETALDALQYGYQTVVLTDCVRAVNVQAHDGDDALAAIQKAGGHLLTSVDLEKGKSS